MASPKRITLAPPSAALAVLSDRSLVATIAAFQRGIPCLMHSLQAQFDAVHPTLPRSRKQNWWANALAHGDLRAVQFVCRLRHMPAYAELETMKVFQDDLPKYAVTWGRLDVLQWLTASGEEPAPWSGSLFAHAMLKRHKEIAAWLWEHRPDACVSDLTGALASAAASGDLVMLLTLELRVPNSITPAMMDAALANRHWDVIMYLHNHPSSVGCTTRGFDLAADRGHLDVVEFLHAHRTEGGTTKAMDKAAFNGDLAMVKFLHEHRTEGCTTKAMDNAAYAGHLDVVRFLHEHRTEGCTTNAMDYAAMNGHLEVVAFLHEHRTEGCTEKALTEAVVKGHVEIVQFLHEKRQLEAPGWLLESAISAGNVALATYLHDAMGLPFDKRSLTCAKESGNSDMTVFVTERISRQENA